jgi:hypothetical protein
MEVFLPAKLGIDLRDLAVSWAAPLDWPTDPSTARPAVAEFRYQANENEVSVGLYKAEQCRPGSNVVAHAGSYKFVMLRLGEVCGGGEWAATEILVPPTRGQLYEFVPKQQLWPYSRALKVL